MPDGVVQWFDPSTGDAAVVRGGHVYSAVASDLEPVARRAGAHVHFDIERGQGAEHAVDVTLRPGTRASHQHRRYGTLVGARRADTKGSAPFAHAHPERGRSLASHPLEVARAWVDSLQSRDLDGALSLYRSDAVLHADGEDHRGRSHLSAYLEASPLFGIDRDPDIRGEDGMALVQWAGIELRAHAAGQDMGAAVDFLQRRLRDKLEQRAEHREWLRTRIGVPEPGEWRHGDLPAARPEYFDRPAEDRQLVRHKTYAMDELTPDEAAFDMDQLDYDFHLFRDLASGEDSMLERTPEGTYRMARLHPASVDPGPVSITMTIVEVPPPELTVRDAKERLDADGERFLFFENSATHRGSIIYRRYDGHYGLVVPA